MSIRLAPHLPVLVAFLLVATCTAQDEPESIRIPGDSQPLVDAISGAASAGDARQQANERIRAMNGSMREHYTRTLASRSARIDPVIVVQFDGVGGTFNLRDGDRHVTIRPVPETYELAKGVAHAPLGIYAILAPYLSTPESDQWHSALRDFGTAISGSLEHLDESALTGKAREGARVVLRESVRFVDATLAGQTFTIEDYRAYAGRIFPSVVELRYFATDVQTRSVVNLLETWRDEMGPQRWSELSAVVISPHTLSVETPPFQCLRFVMDPERVEDRLIHVGGDYGKDVDVAISVLGRLYTDRLAARLAFQGDPERVREMTISLGSKRDLMADPTASVLRTIARERE